MGMFGKKPSSTGNDDLDKVLSRGKYGEKVTNRQLKKAAREADRQEHRRRIHAHMAYNTIQEGYYYSGENKYGVPQYRKVPSHLR